MEFIRKAVKLGNSAGVILPRRLLGAEVKITVVARPVNIKRETLNLISEYLSDVIGIFVINRTPLEVLVVSGTTKRVYETPRIKVIVIPISTIKKDMKTNFILRQRLEKAMPVLNKSLLATLKQEAKSSSR